MRNRFVGKKKFGALPAGHPIVLGRKKFGMCAVLSLLLLLFVGG